MKTQKEQFISGLAKGMEYAATMGAPDVIWGANDNQYIVIVGGIRLVEAMDGFDGSYTALADRIAPQLAKDLLAEMGNGEQGENLNWEVKKTMVDTLLEVAEDDAPSEELVTAVAQSWMAAAERLWLKRYREATMVTA